MILVGLFRPLVGQEVAKDFTVIFVSGDTDKDILHPRARVFTHSLAGIYQRVDDGCAYGSIVVSAEEMVLAAQGQRPDGILDEVVVYAEPAVGHVAAQTGHQGQRVFDGLAYAAVL